MQIKNTKWNKYLRTDQLETPSFIVFCLSTVFMIFCSVSAVQIWEYPWNQLSILLACLSPLLLIVIYKIPVWIFGKELRIDFLFVIVIVILGLLNIYYSEDRPATYKAMSLFLMTGIGVFGISSCVLNTKKRQILFLRLCWICLLVLCIYGLFEFSYKNDDAFPILLFSYNPIPAGSLLILLLIGPLLLFYGSEWRLRLIYSISIFLGITVVCLIGERGPILGLIAAAFVMGILHLRKFWIAPVLALILIASGYYFFYDYLPHGLKKNILTGSNTISRLEHYYFASHIFSKKPLFGVGLRAPLKPHLSDYKIKLKHPPNRWYKKEKDLYPKHIKNARTLENIILSGLVEMGGLFSVTYAFFILYLLIRLFRDNWKTAEQKLRVTLFLAPLFGFFIHSITFDSLIFPHLNWLFHSYLGMMANFDKFNDN